ncbi:D-glycerate dehydrogenase [Duganella sp. FT92W]|uniref:D-glycerate dehydrogenase n=1 Tax=Pseudoduganella rivuli TaxID=2666085 RepID=A0A7X2LSJ2_9BURK|nr:D-glycerate dehydrogenase [Pseudoduganella rivuli]MRV71973.1 D-glycerate dehydrogenase [Pseudoduganella rivuli]
MIARLLCATPMLPTIADRAVAQFNAVTSQARQLTTAETIEALRRMPSALAVLISSRIRFDSTAIAALPPQVKLIATCSVGYDHIDVAAASACGIHVSNTPDVVTEATADLALFLMLGALRRGREYASIMERGWRERFGLGDMLGQDFHGKTLGIIGMGRIGQAVAKRARGFGVGVVYHNRRRLAPAFEQGATYFSDVRAMLPHCQILSLHAPGGGGGCIDAAMLTLLPRGAVLVNTARGTLVNEDDLLAALDSGQLGAAGLDVFKSEPEYDLRFRDLPNVFMTPHMGTATIETREAMGFRALDNVGDIVMNRYPRDAVRCA